MSLLRQWDRLGIYLLLMSFGAYSIFYPIVSLERSAPYWASLVLGVEFFLAGALLILGMASKPGYRMAGLFVVAIGLATISLVIASFGGLRVLAYAFLFGAFAMQAVHDIRRERRTRATNQQNTTELEHELVELVKDMRQGEGP